MRENTNTVHARDSNKLINFDGLLTDGHACCMCNGREVPVLRSAYVLRAVMLLHHLFLGGGGGGGGGGNDHHTHKLCKAGGHGKPRIL